MASLYLQIHALSSTSSTHSSPSHHHPFSVARRMHSPIPCSLRTDRCEVAGSVCSRRDAATATASVLAALSLMLVVGGDAHARDIPIFGIRKVQKIEEQVVKEVKELVKEGVLEAKESVGAVEEAVKESVASLSSFSPKSKSTAANPLLSPALQAGIVAGAEVVAFLVASSVVDGLVSKPSK